VLARSRFGWVSTVYLKDGRGVVQDAWLPSDLHHTTTGGTEGVEHILWLLPAHTAGGKKKKKKKKKG